MKAEKEKFLVITGHSDDIIPFDGSINDESYPGGSGIIQLPDNTEIHFKYDGLWSFKESDKGTKDYQIEVIEADEVNDQDGRVIIHKPIEYVFIHSEEETKVYGNITLSVEMEAKFDQLKDLLSDANEWNENEVAVRAILLGKL